MQILIKTFLSVHFKWSIFIFSFENVKHTVHGYFFIMPGTIVNDLQTTQIKQMRVSERSRQPF